MSKAETETRIRQVCVRFGLQGEYLRFSQLDSGHINTTYRVYFQEGMRIREYVLQQVNTYVFQNPVAVMDNIASVTQFLRKKMRANGEKTARGVLRYLLSDNGKYYLQTADGAFWRCCHYIGNSVSFENTNDLVLIEQSGKAFGAFGRHLSAFPVERLHIVIPHFHNTVMRYQALREAEQADGLGRRKETEALLCGFYDLEALATRAYRLQRQGVLPLRVTHNDTKISNVLFDRHSKAYLSVIDLDTVMPGLAAFDFGDAIRGGASTAAEDEGDLTKVTLDLDKYEAFTRGYVGELGALLSAEELNSLPLGALAMTLECGVRFLTDYLNGDVYFRIHYPSQNLLRARCHLQLAREMLRHFDRMQSIVERYVK